MREYTAKVRILKESSADRSDTRDAGFARNPHARDNVNVAQGPRTGNEGAHKQKRGAFLDSKAERYELSDQILHAFAGREAELTANPGEHDVHGSGGIDSNSQIRRFTQRKNKYKD
jgi:hypothetical protein